MAEETTINYYTHWNLAGPGASAQTPHRTAEFPHNRNECLHKSHPQSGFSNYNFGDDAHLRFNITHSIYEHITSESPTQARLRVFLKPPREMRQGEKAPELHAIIDISKRIDVHDWENIVRGRLVPALLTRGQQEDLLSHVVTGLTLDVPIVSDVSTNTKPIETSTPQITDFFKKTGK
jgi:hypothetical protein